MRPRRLRLPATRRRAEEPPTSAIQRDPFAIPSIPNLRDAGGLPVPGGRRVRTGVLYRSAGLAHIAPEDAAAFAALGVRTVYDLRMASEQTQAPDRLPPDTRHVASDVLAAWADGGPAQLFEWFQHPASARAALADGGAEALWAEQYRAFVTMPSARDAYGVMLRDLAADGSRPALVHCTTGKDRTGWIVAVLQRLLGVDEADVMDHYLESRHRIAPLVEPVLAQLAARGGDPEWFRPVFDVRPAYLEAALAAVREAYGSIEGYVADGLGVEAEARAALREAFLA